MWYLKPQIYCQRWNSNWFYPSFYRTASVLLLYKVPAVYLHCTYKLLHFALYQLLDYFFFFWYAVCLAMAGGVKSCTTLGTHVASVQDEFYRSISSHLYSHFALTSSIPVACFSPSQQCTYTFWRWIPAHSSLHRR